MDDFVKKLFSLMLSFGYWRLSDMMKPCFLSTHSDSCSLTICLHLLTSLQSRLFETETHQKEANTTNICNCKVHPK